MPACQVLDRRAFQSVKNSVFSSRLRPYEAIREVKNLDYLKRLRDLREDRDLSQAKIAAFLHIGQRTYSDYKMGKTCIPIDAMIALVGFYQVSMGYRCALKDVSN